MNHTVTNKEVQIMKEGKVFECINKVQGALAATGIAKDSYNPAQKFNFRGIDAVYKALAPLLAEHRLCISPNIISREVTERTSRQGGTLFCVILTVEYTFVCVEDGSSHVCIILGEAMDSGDKAISKAMSCAYKNLALQIFCVPTSGDNDADAHSPEVAQSAPPVASWVELNDLIFDMDVADATVAKWIADAGCVGTIKDLPDAVVVQIINNLKGK
jgi:hypothetical protein